MSRSKEKFLRFMDYIEYRMTKNKKLLDFMVDADDLDDFLCESQADESAVHQPVEDAGLVPF